jgi:sugar lactone lactonase YvrE
LGSRAGQRDLARGQPHGFPRISDLRVRNDLDLDAERDLFFTDPLGTDPRPTAGAVYQYSRDGVLRRVMDSGLFPNGISVSADDTVLAIGDFRGDRVWYSPFLNGLTWAAPMREGSAAPSAGFRAAKTPKQPAR